MLKIVIIVMACYAVLVFMAYLRQDSMLYYPIREIEQTPKDRGIAYDDVSLVTEDGVTISGWYIPAKEEKGILLFCHGNAGNISHRMDSIKIFHDLGLTVFIFDYRGYGKSEGKPSEEGTYLDAEAAWNFLTIHRRVPPEKIIIFGRSLGSAVATEIALRKNPGALIIESGFTSVPDLGKKYYPWLPVRLISRYRYTTVDKVGAIQCPKMIIHSPDDEIIPFEQGRRVFERAAPPKSFLAITGGHNEGFLVSGSLYHKGLKDFLSSHHVLKESPQ